MVNYGANCSRYVMASIPSDPFSGPYNPLLFSFFSIFNVILGTTSIFVSLNKSENAITSRSQTEEGMSLIRDKRLGNITVVCLSCPSILALLA